MKLVAVLQVDALEDLVHGGRDEVDPPHHRRRRRRVGRHGPGAVEVVRTILSLVVIERAEEEVPKRGRERVVLTRVTFQERPDVPEALPPL